MKMSKKLQKLRPDTILKNYWNNNDRFADLFNAVLFKGENVIKPETLQNEDTEMSNIYEHEMSVDSIQAARDVFKLVKQSDELGVEFALLGIENQQSIHYAMPFRVMEYDAYVYKKQYDRNAEIYKKGKKKELTQDEFLSKMKKTDRFLPVITLVVYYGEEAWDGAIDIYGMLNIPQKLKLFVNNYKMHLIEVRKNDLELHNINNRDLFNLFEILYQRSSDRKEIFRKVKEYEEKNKVDKSVVMAIAATAKNNINLEVYNRKGEMDMCTFFEELIQEGKEEGKKEGRKEGRAQEIVRISQKYHVSEESILKELTDELQITMEQARKFLDMFGKQKV